MVRFEFEIRSKGKNIEATSNLLRDADATEKELYYALALKESVEKACNFLQEENKKNKTHKQ